MFNKCRKSDFQSLSEGEHFYMAVHIALRFGGCCGKEYFLGVFCAAQQLSSIPTIVKTVLNVLLSKDTGHSCRTRFFLMKVELGIEIIRRTTKL